MQPMSRMYLTHTKRNNKEYFKRIDRLFCYDLFVSFIFRTSQNQFHAKDYKLSEKLSLHNIISYHSFILETSIFAIILLYNIRNIRTSWTTIMHWIVLNKTSCFMQECYIFSTSFKEVGLLR